MELPRRSLLSWRVVFLTRLDFRPLICRGTRPSCFPFLTQHLAPDVLSGGTQFFAVSMFCAGILRHIQCVAWYRHTRPGNEGCSKECRREQADLVACLKYLLDLISFDFHEASLCLPVLFMTCLTSSCAGSRCSLLRRAMRALTGSPQLRFVILSTYPRSLNC